MRGEQTAGTPPAYSLEIKTLAIQYTPLRKGVKVFSDVFFGKFISVFGEWVKRGGSGGIEADGESVDEEPVNSMTGERP